MAYTHVVFYFMCCDYMLACLGDMRRSQGNLRSLLFLLAGYMTMDVVGTSAFGCALCDVTAVSEVLTMTSGCSAAGTQCDQTSRWKVWGVNGGYCMCTTLPAAMLAVPKPAWLAS